jgi:hypothetical protein
MKLPHASLAWAHELDDVTTTSSAGFARYTADLRQDATGQVFSAGLRRVG